MKRIDKSTKVEVITTAKNSGETGKAVVSIGEIFNFDGFLLELEKEQEEFLNSLNYKEFKEIPSDMLDGTTANNFIYCLKLAK